MTEIELGVFRGSTRAELLAVASAARGCHPGAMTGSGLSPDARQVLLALRALRAATTGALAAASGLSLEVAAAALDELAVTGEARRTAEGTWLPAREHGAPRS